MSQHENENHRREKDPISWLTKEFQTRRNRNHSYSLRAFARNLQVPAGPLSEIIARKRTLTTKMGIRIADRLGFSEEEKKAFLSLIVEQEDSATVIKEGENLGKHHSDYKQISFDQFAIVADWYHFALLSLIETDDFKNDPKWMASRLKITVREVKEAVDRLIRMGFIVSEGKKLRPAQNGVATTSNTPCAALRESHRQSLEQAISALDEVSVKDSDITSITMAIDPKKIQIAKELIQNFRRYLARVLETGERTEVYNLNVQLIPVSDLRGTER